MRCETLSNTKKLQLDQIINRDRDELIYQVHREDQGRPDKHLPGSLGRIDTTKASRANESNQAPGNSAGGEEDAMARTFLIRAELALERQQQRERLEEHLSGQQ